MPDPKPAFTPAPPGGQEPLRFAGPATIPAFDPIDALPPAAADKLRLLRQRAKDAHALVPPFELVREASEAKQVAAGALRRLTEQPGAGGFSLSLDHRSVIEEQKRLDQATAALERITDLQRSRTSAWQAAAGALTACEAWLKAGRSGAALADVDVEPPKLAKGESLTDGIERLRRRVRELRADARRVASAPFPSAHAKVQMRAQVEALAAVGAPGVARLVELDGPVEFPSQQVRSGVLAERPALGFAELPDSLALLAWLHKEALIKRLDGLIEAEADDAASLSHEERQRRQAELGGDLRAVELEESALVFAAMAQSLLVEHRPDADPAAVLGVAPVAGPHAATDTSWQHAWDVVWPGGR